MKSDQKKVESSVAKGPERKENVMENGKASILNVHATGTEA